MVMLTVRRWKVGSTLTVDALPTHLFDLGIILVYSRMKQNALQIVCANFNCVFFLHALFELIGHHNRSKKLHADIVF